jgi:hypothetical protein
MAAKKMFPPGEIEKPLGRHVESPFGDDYDEVKLGIAFVFWPGKIVMQFSDHVEWIRMTSGGARKLAARLTEKADELDRLGKVPASSVKPARPQKGKKSVTPLKRAPQPSANANASLSQR